MSVNPNDPRQRQLQGLALLLQLQRKARSAQDAAELAFIMVNETRSLLDYRQAALWIADARAVKAVSGVAQLEANAPYIVWLNGVAQTCDSGRFSGAAQAVGAQDLPERLRQDWPQWLPPFGLWLPLRYQGRAWGGLLLAREQPWQEADSVLLAELADAYAHAWQALHRTRPGWLKSISAGSLKYWLVGLTALMLLPVRQSVLAPAEVIAAEPVVVRAPLEGVVDSFSVLPNQNVSGGQLLLSLTNTDIANRLEIARKAWAVAEAEYRKSAQQAMFDPDSKAELAVLKSRIDQHAAEVAYMQDQMERSQIKAPRDGIAIFSDVHDWIGRPVALGERILMLADPAKAELEMRLPVADYIEFADGAQAVMFLNVDPQHPLDAEVYSVSYQAEAGADQTLAYRVKARLRAQDQVPRIGLKGTAKLYGPRVSLFYYLFRRPLAAARQWLGL
ncbi:MULTISPECIES: efflux RND transporter periplasmic adaptor subunit [Methylomonas]|uniref:efflux RND transporter periplasmic adaptor subunit n=1 Tax=Methylomonas TaxID=416 RepID=UPI0012324539|nr:HlyD family efflux transporter periplasmic adaptor subunit [Methylomonas rhizoryzae]